MVHITGLYSLKQWQPFLPALSLWRPCDGLATEEGFYAAFFKIIRFQLSHEVFMDVEVVC